MSAPSYPTDPIWRC